MTVTEQKQTVAPPTRTLCEWAQKAPRGAWCQYHVGRLSLDRAKDRGLHEIAETVALLQEHGYLTASQMRVPNDPDGTTAYLATRTGLGFPPSCILDCSVSAIDYRALHAIKTRAADMSAARALRYAMSISEAAAVAMLDSLKSRGMVDRAQIGGGWDISPMWHRKVF